VLCSNEALSHEDEDYKLGDSSGCDAGFVQVRDQWECFAAPDRVNSFTIGISTTGDQRGADYLSYGLTSGKGNSKSGYASPGCGYMREGSAKSPSNDKNSENMNFASISKLYDTENFKKDSLKTLYISSESIQISNNKSVRGYDSNLNDQSHIVTFNIVN